MYERSIRGNFPAIESAVPVAPRGTDPEAYRAAARRLIADVEGRQ
jgi:hypothetical protein